MRDVTGARLDDDESVASEGDVDISLRKRGRQRIDGVERDKHGEIIRMCGMAGCQYKTGHGQHMKVHKAAKHGINVVWFSCDQDNCFSGTTVIHAFIKQSKRSTSNDTNKRTTIE
ncbi:hypothetical protein TrLO_g14242 [Triparma laevis f. longispina]|uniref:Uncharacterized protein n=1 Tax=Triparma laevis f. longispina TaxID=1714387 RepID=A0A9W7FLR3_9STRA|nr:hypothetical protein TrLO_g14242 [Triparma laevis f. longispina]